MAKEPICCHHFSLVIGLILLDDRKQILVLNSNIIIIMRPHHKRLKIAAARLPQGTAMQRASQAVHHYSAPLKKRYPYWHDVSDRFSGSRNCFAAYLAMEAAEVIEGAKPGNLINLVNRDRSCGLNPYRLWQFHGNALLAGSGLQARVLADRGNSLLLFLYREDLLRATLQRRGVAIILKRQGYEQPDNLPLTLDQLGNRILPGSFPHEVGIFLGYPLKDVLAFMGEIRLVFSCQGPWKIYGDPASSLELACRYRECRAKMADRLRTARYPANCLQARQVGQC